MDFIYIIKLSGNGHRMISNKQTSKKEREYIFSRKQATQTSKQPLNELM